MEPTTPQFSGKAEALRLHTLANRLNALAEADALSADAIRRIQSSRAFLLATIREAETALEMRP